MNEPEKQHIDVEKVKSHLQSAKAELKKRYGETVEHIKKDLDKDIDKTRTAATDSWDKLKTDFNK